MFNRWRGSDTVLDPESDGSQAQEMAGRTPDWEYEAREIVRDLQTVRRLCDLMAAQMETPGEVDKRPALGKAAEEAFSNAVNRRNQWVECVPALDSNNGRFLTLMIFMGCTACQIEALRLLITALGYMLYQVTEEDGKRLDEATLWADDFYKANALLLADAIAGKLKTSHMGAAAGMTVHLQKKMDGDLPLMFERVNEVGTRLP